MRALFALNPYIWKYKKHLLWGIVFVVISNIFSIFPAQIVRNALNVVSEVVALYGLFEGFSLTSQLSSMLFQSLWIFAVLVLLMALGRGFFLFFTRQTLIVMSRLIEYDIRNDIYDHFQQMSLSFYRRNRTGDLMARLTEDVSRVRMYLGPGIMYTINTVSLFVVIVTTMMLVNAELTLYALVPLPILSYLIFYVESIIQHRSERIQNQLSRLTTFAQEIFSGIRVVKAYVKEKPSGDRFATEVAEYKTRSLHLARVDAVFYPLVVLLVGLSTILTIWIGGEKVITGRLSIGNIAEFLIYINLLTWPIVAIGWVTTLIQRAAASQVRLNELMSERSEIEFSQNDVQIETGAITFEDVYFTYADTGIEALKGVSFSLKPGQKLGIIGPTGSGKSTLCAMIPRLFQPEAGDILLDGKSIADFSKSALRNEIGYAPQDVFLFSDNIKNNVAFGKLDATQEEIELATQRASIYESIVDFPEKWETMVGERGVTLSGGQKQRISVARAWIREPKVLILDDVLSAVDTRTEEHVLHQLKTYRTEHPQSVVVMVAHRISCIQDADLIIVIEEGKIVEKGDHASLLKQKGYYERIYKKQLAEEVGVS